MEYGFRWNDWDRDQRPAQVVYIIDDDGTIFIIHARPLTDREKKRERRRS